MRMLGLTLLAVLALAAPAAAAGPDLIVSAGRASISGTTISGSFTIKNKGRPRRGVLRARGDGLAGLRQRGRH